MVLHKVSPDDEGPDEGSTGEHDCLSLTDVVVCTNGGTGEDPVDELTKYLLTYNWV